MTLARMKKIALYLEYIAFVLRDEAKSEESKPDGARRTAGIKRASKQRSGPDQDSGGAFSNCKE